MRLKEIILEPRKPSRIFSRRKFMAKLAVGIPISFVAQEEYIRRARKRFEENYPRENKALSEYFDDIGQAAKRITRDYPEIMFPGMIAGFFTGSEIVYTNGKTRRVFISSLISSGIGRLLDHYSTYRVLKLFEDPRFKEYGLDALFFESNVEMGFHPSAKTLLSPAVVLNEIGIVALSGINTPFAYALSGASAGAAMGNSRVESLMRTYFSIGDKVKFRINKGDAPREIKEYLATLNRV